MNTHLRIGAIFLIFIIFARADEGKLTIERLPLDKLNFELPTCIKLRVRLAELQHPEYAKNAKELGLEGLGADDARGRMDSWVRVYKVSDGMVFLTDHLHMGLWVREGGRWKCMLTGLRVEKTFGGATPHLPARYLGGGLFAVSETVPERIQEKKDGLFPQALAVTFLLDTKKGEIIERSKSFIYDHTPPVKVPDLWKKRYQLKQIEDGSGNPFYRTDK